MSAVQPDLADGATRTLATFSAGLTYDKLPATVSRHLKQSILDGIGCMVHGAALPWTQKIASMVQAEGGRPEASLFDASAKVPAAAAALVNGTAGHAFELDDIHRDSIIHPNSLTLSVAFALAERNGGCSGRDFITAVAAGYEIGARIGAAAGPGLLLAGFHPQGTTGTFAAAATAAHMLGLNADATLHALGTAGSLGAGLMAAQEGAMVKRLHSGRAAETGLRAALLAKDGFTGIDNVVEAGYGGFIAAHSDTPLPKRLLSGLGEDWEILNTGFKPHATVTSIHTCLDALAMIRAEHNLTADGIAAIEAAVSTPTHVHCAWPYAAQGVTAAQMNIYFGLAVMALEGEAFVQQFTPDRVADPAVLEMIGRIEARVDPAIDALGPAHRHTASITVTTTDGRRLEKRVENRKGSPDNPLTEAEVETKFRALTAGSLDADRQTAVIDTVQNMEIQPDVLELIGIAISSRA
jgi:2-methylcitrate dehydratase PrpD